MGAYRLGREVGRKGRRQMSLEPSLYATCSGAVKCSCMLRSWQGKLAQPFLNRYDASIR